MIRKTNSFLNYELKEISFYVIFGLFVSIVVPIFIGLSLGGFEESFVAGKPLAFGDLLTNYMIYYVFIIAGLLGIVTLKIREIFLVKQNQHALDIKNPDPFAIAILHDPEQDGALWRLFNTLHLNKNPMRWSKSIVRCFVIAIIIFSALGLFQATTNTFFFKSDIPQTAFQITPFTEAYFSSEPASFGETMLAIFILCLLVGLWAYICNKLNFEKSELGRATFWTVYVVVIPILIGLLWMSYHYIVYGNTEAKLLATFIFGWLGALLTVLMGSFIWWYVMHFMNNLFIKLGTMITAKEDLVFITIIILALLTLLWVGTEIWLYKNHTKTVNITET